MQGPMTMTINLWNQQPQQAGPLPIGDQYVTETGDPYVTEDGNTPYVPES